MQSWIYSKPHTSEHSPITSKGNRVVHNIILSHTCSWNTLLSDMYDASVHCTTWHVVLCHIVKQAMTSWTMAYYFNACFGSFESFIYYSNGSISMIKIPQESSRIAIIAVLTPYMIYTDGKHHFDYNQTSYFFHRWFM